MILPPRKKTNFILPESEVKTLEREEPSTFRMLESLGGGEFSNVITPRDVSQQTKSDIRGGSFAETDKEVDHIISKALGGTDSIFNLQALKSNPSLMQSVYSKITGKDISLSDRPFEKRQEGKVLVEREAINAYKAGKITRAQAINRVVNWEEPKSVWELYPKAAKETRGKIGNFLKKTGKDYVNEALIPAIEGIKKIKGGITDVDAGDVPVSGTLYEAGNVGKILYLDNKIKKGTIEEDEKEWFNEYLKLQEEEAKKFEDPYYRIGATIKGSVTFMAELGLASLMAAPTGGGSLGTLATAKLSQKTAKEVIEKIIKDKATRSILADISKKKIKQVTKESIIVGGLHTPQGALERIVGTPEFKENGEFIGLAEDGQDVGEAIVNSFTSNLVKVASERTGDFFSLLGKPIKNSMIKGALLKSTKKVNPKISTNKIADLFHNAGWNGIVNEYLEERVGDVMNGALEKVGLGDQPFKMPTLQQSVEELASFALMGGVIKALETADKKRIKLGLTIEDVSGKASGQPFDEWVKGQGELPITRESKIVWQANKEGRQKIGNTQILRKPTLEDFKKEILPRTRAGYYGTGSIESQYKGMIQKEPNITISFIDKGKGWEVSKIDDLTNIQKEIQAGIEQGWAKVVDDFESSIAQKIRASADSEIKFPIKTRSQLKAEWDATEKQTLDEIFEKPAKPELLSEKATKIQETPLPKPQAESQNLPVSKEILSQPQIKLDTISYKENIAQKSSIVKPKEKVNILKETYNANRIKLNEKTGKIQRAKDLKSGLSSIGKGTDKILGTISTRLKNIDPSLKTAIRSYEFKLANSVQKDRKAVAPFLKAVRSKNLAKEDYLDLDLALKNGDITKIDEIIKKYGLEKEFKTVRSVLDDLYKRAEEVGYDIGYKENYFPRMIEDSEGLLEYFQKGDDWSIIEEAIRAKETDLGRYLDVKEKANLINTLIRGYQQGKITLSKTGAMKARQIDIVDAELNQFYHDSVATLLRYVDETNDAIEARRFFGNGNKTDQFANINDSIGAYILDLLAKGKIKLSQEKELKDILQARFSEVGTSGAMRVYKNLSYIDTMGSTISAITQIGDLAFAIYKGGVIESTKAFARAVVRKSKITRADIGIEKIAQEFQDSASSANAVSKVFKIIGLEKLDALGKETVINASIEKLIKLAKNPTPQFLKKMELIFGDKPEVISKVINNLKLGKTTEDVKLIAFNELLDVQPVALSEMPEQYLKGGNGRIFYMLKTYTIKLFDVYRNEVFQEIAAGNKIQGIKNLIKLTGALVVMNATADEIKDFILNRKTSLTDRVVDNILKLAGFSKFTIYKARQEGIGSAVAKTILPPFKFIDSAYKDIVQANEISQLETIQSIPVGGKLYYWWFGKGATKTKEKTKSSRTKELDKIFKGGTNKRKTLDEIFK